MSYRFFLFILLAALLNACIPEPVDIDISQPEPRLVVAAQMVSDSIVLVQVSRSFGALEYSESHGDELDDAFLNQILVEHAHVTLSHSSGIDTLFRIGRGFYIALNTPLVPHESYLLRAFDPATEFQVYAESKVLPATDWEKLSYSFVEESVTLFDSTYTDTVLQVDASFEDLPGENYYMINAYRITGRNSQNQHLLFGNSEPGTRIYSDQLYNGTQIRDTINYPGFYPGDTVAFAISHIGKGYYEYLSTRQRSGTSLFANLLHEPVNFPTNVEGGYGFFNLHLPQIEIRILE